MSEPKQRKGEQELAFSRLTWARFGRAIKSLATSDVGGKAIALFVLLVVFLLGINGLNVVNSYVGRDFMTAIERRSMPDFLRWGLIYIGVFAASTVVAVLYRFAEERLALLWRTWISQIMVRTYMENRTYYRLEAAGELANPDQRIAEDARAFTATTISFMLMFLNGTLTILAFAGVLWSISPLLFGVAVGYAALGSLLTIALGHPLVRLNYAQLDKEANFRADLIHVRENAESIAMSQHEPLLSDRVVGRLDALAENLRRIIAVNRNLGFFTTGYNYMIQIIPALVVAPLFIRGQAEFGVITQSAMAFAHLVGAFSLVVTQFQSISSFAAVTARLSWLVEAIERAASVWLSGLDIRREGANLVYEGVTLRSPRDRRVLIDALSLSVPPGTRVRIVGPNETAKVALFRATAGIWQLAEGRIAYPEQGGIRFLPERPYLPLATLRRVLTPSTATEPLPEERMRSTLRELGVEHILTRAGGLEVEKHWDDMLSFGEQQLLAAARVLLERPRFVFLDHPDTALPLEQVRRVLELCSECSITYLMLDPAESMNDCFDATLELATDGRWSWTPTVAGDGGPSSGQPPDLTSSTTGNTPDRGQR